MGKTSGISNENAEVFIPQEKKIKGAKLSSSISFLGFLLLEELWMFFQTIVNENNMMFLAFGAKYLLFFLSEAKTPDES